tara:strand:+ start:15234 stop:17120 length:1887 start_codon:yes stop_codon:yes gene_type:complete
MEGFGNNNNKQLNTQEKNRLLKLGVSHQSSGDIDSAKKTYELFLSKGFTDASLMVNLALIYSKSKNTKDAISLLKKTINLFPNKIEALLILGSELFNSNELLESEKVFKKAIDIDPKNISAYGNLSTLYTNQGKYLKAEECLKKIIQLNPRLSIAYANLGAILRDQGNLKESELVLREALRIDPKLYNAYSNLAMILLSKREVINAEKLIRKAISINPKIPIAYSNLAWILNDQAKLEEAKVIAEKSLQLNPNLFEGYSILGKILISQGKLVEGEESLLKAISIKNHYSNPYFQLSRLSKSKRLIQIKKLVLSLDDNNFKKPIEKSEIYFAKSNILHGESNYMESSENLLKANNLKLSIYPSEANEAIAFTNQILNETKNLTVNNDTKDSIINSIFIVGLPRCGSTLVESILSTNNSINALGERNILMKKYHEWTKGTDNQKEEVLCNLYYKEINSLSKYKKITTDKFLFNYAYTGYIATHFYSSKIINCFRHPLDNILSIYRANFSHSYRYSSSLEDCARILINKEKVMREYKNRYPFKIYDLDYDRLVLDPDKEIKNLISWLKLEWNDYYLSPHLNTREVLTASNIQIRSPINSKSLGGWKNYKTLLKPAINLLLKNNFSEELINN